MVPRMARPSPPRLLDNERTIPKPRPFRTRSNLVCSLRRPGGFRRSRLASVVVRPAFDVLDDRSGRSRRDRRHLRSSPRPVGADGKRPRARAARQLVEPPEPGGHRIARRASAARSAPSSERWTSSPAQIPSICCPGPARLLLVLRQVSGDVDRFRLSPNADESVTTASGLSSSLASTTNRRVHVRRFVIAAVVGDRGECCRRRHAYPGYACAPSSVTSKSGARLRWAELWR